LVIGTIAVDLAIHLPQKNGERGKLGQERLEVGWEVVVFLFNIVNLNV
jgi:hypothetical protein